MTPAARAAGPPGSPDLPELAGEWRPPADESEASAALALLGAVARADGVAAVSGHVLEAIRQRTARWVIARAGNAPEPIGLAVALAGDPAEVAVHPEQRRRGWGSALVAAAVRRQGGVWAYGDLPPARGLAERLGLRRGRVLLQLRRSLPLQDAGDERPTAPGVRIRAYRPGDDRAIVAINARAFAWHPEQGRMTIDDLHEQMAEEWFDPAGLLVAVADAGPGESGDTVESTGADRLLGFHWTKVHPGSLGEVYVLAVDPESPVRGLGTPLTRAGLAHLAATGQRAVMLYVEGDNDRARHLYERMGFEAWTTNVVYE